MIRRAGIAGSLPRSPRFGLGEGQPVPKENRLRKKGAARYPESSALAARADWRTGTARTFLRAAIRNLTTSVSGPSR